VTDAKMPKEGSINYQSVISGFARMGYNVNIIIGTVFEHQDISAHRKAASGSGGNLYQLIFYQKIGTMKEYKTLILNNRSIYIDPSNTMKPSSDDFKNLAKIDEGRIYAKYSFASPENMAEIYNDFYGEKILEKGKIISNLRVNLEKLFYSKEISGRKDLPQKILFGFM
jgi:hypothetical protein